MKKRLGKFLQINRGGFCLLVDAEDRHGFSFWLNEVPGYSEGIKPEALGLKKGVLLCFEPDYMSDRAKHVEVVEEIAIEVVSEVSMNQVELQRQKYRRALKHFLIAVLGGVGVVALFAKIIPVDAVPAWTGAALFFSIFVWIYTTGLNLYVQDFRYEDLVKRSTSKR